MSYIRLIASIVLASALLIGCALEESAPDDIDAVESVNIEYDVDTNSVWAPEDSPESEATAQSCFEVWTCRRCPNNTNRNLLVEFCDDGSQRIISAGPCGQPCF